MNNIPKLFCPKCKELGLKSTVRNHGGSQTLMETSSYHDEDGKYHYHDPNSISQYHTCSNNHSFTSSRNHPCPNKNCDFGKGESTIVIEDDLKPGTLYYNPNAATISED